MKAIELQLPLKKDLGISDSADPASLDAEILAVASIHVKMLQNLMDENAVYTTSLAEALSDISETYKTYSDQVRRLAIKKV